MKTIAHSFSPLVIAAVIASSVLSLLPGSASALSCMRPEYPEIARTGAMVVATVTSVDTGGPSTNWSDVQVNRVTVTVERGWGNAQQSMLFNNPLRGTWTGTPERGLPIPFQLGQRYLIVMAPGQSGLMEADLGACSSSFKITDEGQLASFIAAREHEGMGQGTVFSPGPNPGCASDDCYPTTPQTYCPQLSSTMSRGARDVTTRPQGQVSELQRFLSDYYDIDESVIVSGFFGRNTQSHVMRFQREQGLPVFGVVGSMTRAKIAAVCGGGAVTPPPYACTMEYAPVCGKPPLVFPTCPANMSCPLGVPDTQPMTYGNRCQLNQANATFLYEGKCAPSPVICREVDYQRPKCNPGEIAVPTQNGQCPGPYTCVPDGTGSTPSITSFSGPTRLSVNETGTWKIIATDSSNGSLTYSIDWGDRAFLMNDMAARSMPALLSTQNTSFTRAYGTPGTYTVTITVSNQYGKVSTASASVIVVGSAAGDTLEIARSPYDFSRVQITGPKQLSAAIEKCVYSRGWFGTGGNGVSIDWGDGTQDIVWNESAMGRSCAEEQRAHSYRSPGTYTITARLWHPGPTDAPITDWQGSAMVTIGFGY